MTVKNAAVKGHLEKGTFTKKNVFLIQDNDPTETINGQRRKRSCLEFSE